MADGVPITAGAGTTVATDDCGADGHAQILKLAISANASATLIPADATTGVYVDVKRLPGSVESNVTSLVAKDFATQTTLAAVLAKLTSDPATQTTLAAVLAKLTSDPATQTTLAAILAKLTADPATQTTLAAVLSAVDGLEGLQAHGTYGYASGTSTTTVDVPAGARVKRVSVLAGTSAATITIVGGSTITVPAGVSFDEQIPGDATLGGDVVIGGTVSTYYVAWTT